VSISTGTQAVPMADPHWNQNGEEENSVECYFIRLIVEGLKMAKSNL
jgi:hypothetical protein